MRRPVLQDDYHAAGQGHQVVKKSNYEYARRPPALLTPLRLRYDEGDGALGGSGLRNNSGGIRGSAGSADRSLARSTHRDYAKASLYGDEAGISQSPPDAPAAAGKASAALYGDGAQVAPRKPRKPRSGYEGGNDSGNDSSPWEEDPNAYIPEVAPVKEDSGESSPWDDDVTPSAAQTKQPKQAKKPAAPASDYVRAGGPANSAPPPSEYVRGAAKAPASDYVRGGVHAPASDYVRGGVQAPASDYVRGGAPVAPASDYVRGGVQAPPPRPPVSAGYGHADDDPPSPPTHSDAPRSDYVRAPAIAVAPPPSDYVSAGRGASAFGAPPTISYPHSDEDNRSSPAPPRHVAGQTHLSAPKR